MNITEVRVKLMEGRSDRLRAFCSITIDNDFVIHDLRVIEGSEGYFVAMPSRKLTDNCPGCGSKNHLRARYCSNCGTRLDENRATRGPSAREKFHVDVAHPINTPCREAIQASALQAYEDERRRVDQGQGAPGHAPRDYPYDEEYDEGVSTSSGGSVGETDTGGGATEADPGPQPREQEDFLQNDEEQGQEGRRFGEGIF